MVALPTIYFTIISVIIIVFRGTVNTPLAVFCSFVLISHEGGKAATARAANLPPCVSSYEPSLLFHYLLFLHSLFMGAVVIFSERVGIRFTSMAKQKVTVSSWQTTCPSSQLTFICLWWPQTCIWLPCYFSAVGIDKFDQIWSTQA